MATRILLIILYAFCGLDLMATDVPVPDAGAKPPASEITEIGLATGKVIQGVITERTDNGIVYHEPQNEEPKKLALADVIFLRSASGKYEFIFPPESAPASAPVQPNAGTQPGSRESWVIAGVGLQFTDNSAMSAFALDYANALAADYNSRLNPAGFVAQAGLDASAASALFSLEYRLVDGRLAYAFSLGYAAIPKSSAVVSSASYTGQETINIDGFFVPVSLLVYYRLWGDQDFGFHIGAGGGALITSVLLTRNYGSGSDYEEVRAVAPMLQLKPELTLRLGSVLLLASLPVYWAEGLPPYDLATGVARNVRTPAASLTGAGIQVAAGYQF